MRTTTTSARRATVSTPSGMPTVQLHTKRGFLTTAFRNKVVAIALSSIAVLSACSDGDTEAGPSPRATKTGIDVTGTFSARMPLEDFADVPGPTDPVYAGAWRIELDAEAAFYRFEHEGYGQVSGEISSADDVLTFDDPPAPEGAFNCYLANGERTFDDGTGTYRATIDDDVLTLSVIDERCPLREAILDRTWTKT